MSVNILTNQEQKSANLSEKISILGETKTPNSTLHLSLEQLSPNSRDRPLHSSNNYLSVPYLQAVAGDSSNDSCVRAGESEASFHKSLAYELFHDDLPEFNSTESLVESSDEDEIDYAIKLAFLDDDPDHAIDCLLFSRRKDIVDEERMRFRDCQADGNAAEERAALEKAQKQEELLIYNKYYADGTLLKYQSKAERQARLNGQRRLREQTQLEYHTHKLCSEIKDMEAEKCLLEQNISKMLDKEKENDLKGRLYRLEGVLHSKQHDLYLAERYLDKVSRENLGFENEQTANEHESAIVAKLRVKMCEKRAKSQARAVQKEVQKHEWFLKQQALERKKRAELRLKDEALHAKIQDHIRKMREKTQEAIHLKLEAEDQKIKQIKRNQEKLKQTIASIQKKKVI